MVTLDLILLTSLLPLAVSTSNGSSYTSMNVNASRSVQYRPAIHFSPKVGFMNDPNGLLFDKETETYHMFYQYNPNDTVAGNQHWGHAISSDLYSWQDEPIALYPSEDDGLAFSGSLVNDVENTSGLFPRKGSKNYVAIYTQAFPDNQVQALAYSVDGGSSFSQFEGNPVLDLNNTQFRDPQVQWYQPSSKWVQTVALAREHKILFYDSSDLIHWELTGEFKAGVLGVDYECPNLVPLRHQDTNETKWVLFVSINPGMPLGGSGTQYFIGDFDGDTFIPDDEFPSTKFIDFAKDNYALQFFNRDRPNLSDEDIDKATYVAWFSNWQYCQEVPTGSWRSAMTLPRQVSLKRDWLGEDTLVQSPRGIDELREDDPTCLEVELDKNYTLPQKSDTIEIFLEGELDDPSSGSRPGTHRLHFDIFNEGGEKIQLGLDQLSAQIWLDRSEVRGFDSPFLTGKFSQAVAQPAKKVSWRIILDGSSLLELFAEDGQVVGTSVFYPDNPLTHIRLSMPKGGSLNGNLIIYALKKTMSDRDSLGSS